MINYNWQAVAYLGAHFVTISKHSRPLLISAPTTFASNGSWWYAYTGFLYPPQLLAVEFTITNKVIVCGNTGPHSYSSYAVVQDIGVEPICNRLEGGCVSATLILHIV